MVGISLGSIKKAGRWIGGLSARQRVAGAVAIVAVAGGLAWLVTVQKAEAALLRSDPDVAATQPDMMKFAVGRGHGVYEHKCASCHGAKATGDPAKGVPNLTDNDWLYGEGKVSDIETVVLYGIRASNSKTWRLADMPAFASKLPYPREPAIPPLSPGDIRDVIQFLYSQEGKPASVEAAQRGASIYSTRGGCWDCHSTDGHGDPSIGAPNLTDNIWLFGDEKSAFYSIAYGRAGYCPAWDKRLSAAKIRETALYVYSLSHQSPVQKSPSAP